MQAATAMTVVIACGDALMPTNTATTAELLILRQQNAAPAPGAQTFWVRNNTVTVRAITHPDAFNTVFMELRFPSGCLASLNGAPLTTEDSVQVTVQPRPGEYGFTLSPSGLAFALSNTPTVEFDYAGYGDLSVADGEAAFATRQEYAAALDVWEEQSIDTWRIARGSGNSGQDAVSSAVDAPGSFVLAARR